MLIDREKMLVLTFRKTRLRVGFNKPVITGFNTDIEHQGVVYHVQTEDKGLDTPIILSLVYAGGTILASKRSPYEDLIASGFSDEVLAERLKRQHKLICAAIHSGRIDDLKKMTRPVKRQVVEEAVTAEPVVEATDEHRSEPIASEEPLPDGLIIEMLDDEEFYSGEKYTLRVFIANRAAGQEKPLASAAVSIKILGTTFRPLIYSLKTEGDGVATVATQIPEFTSGRAAVLVRAVVKDQAAELRRIIHPVETRS